MNLMSVTCTANPACYINCVMTNKPAHLLSDALALLTLLLLLPEAR
jgi:hypothetical protein